MAFWPFKALLFNHITASVVPQFAPPVTWSTAEHCFGYTWPVTGAKVLGSVIEVAPLL